MGLIIYDETYGIIIKNYLNSTGSPPPMRAEFFSGEYLYYYTTQFYARINQGMGSISLIAKCPEENANYPCTNVDIKRLDNGEIIYRVNYETPLQDKLTQLCHIVIKVDADRIDNFGYIVLPVRLLTDAINEDVARVAALEFKKNLFPRWEPSSTNEFYCYIEDIYFDENLKKIVFVNDIRAKITSGYGVIVKDENNDAFFLEVYS